MAVEPGLGLDDGDFGVGTAGLVVVGEVLVAEAVDVEFDGTGAIQAPAVLGNGDSKVPLVVADRGEGGENVLLEVVVGEAVGFGHDVELAGEAVAERVEFGAGFAWFGAGSGGEL